MAESNGSLKVGNGTTHVNGVNGKMNGHTTISRRRAARRNQSLLAWTFGAVARIATWAAILTVLFRCPPSLEACDENSPYICKPYFQVKNVLSPHVQPYYDQYAAPYVEVAKPYYDVVDAKVWQPTRAYAVQYGAPWVERGRDQVWAQWEKNAQPQVAKAQKLVQAKYDQSVGPYVSQTGQAVGPYYEIARTNALQVFYEYLVPSYDFVSPYASKGYDATADFATYTALPATYWAWDKTYSFLDSTVWPHIRVIYRANVEPQLVRIGERLGRYKTKEKVKSFQDNTPVSAASDVYSSFSRPAPQSTTSSSTTSYSTAAAEQPLATEVPEPILKTEGLKEEYSNPVEAPTPDENESDERIKAREMVAHDLELWQNKFAQQADDGAIDMEERVGDIAKKMIRRNANTTGRTMFHDLEKIIESELKGLKAKISSLVESAGDRNSDDVEEEVVAAVRSSGKAIKKKAQAIRAWRETYDKELQETVLSIADVHFQILDETRNLALQQIGMRWAWTDGVTYKDWAKYHQLKSTLTEWTEQLKKLVVTHPTLLEAQDASAQIEDEGMEIAANAAKELARLKEVARWKVAASDATDNFDSEAMKQAAEEVKAALKAAGNLEQPLTGKLEDAASTLSTQFEEATSAAAAAVEDAKDDVREFFSSVVEPISETTASIVDVVEEQSTAASQSASSILAHGEEEVSDATEELSSVALSSVESIATDASSLSSEGTETLASVVEKVAASAESVSSVASESVSSIVGEFTEAASPDVDEVESISVASRAAEASQVLADDAQSVPEDAEDFVPDEDDFVIEEDLMNEREETPVSATQKVKPVWLGAAAQEVPHRQVVLEDYDDTDYVASATDGAAAAYASAVSLASERYSSAASIVSAQIYGTPKPVHEKLLSQMSAAYDNAVAAASTKYDQAIDAAASVKPTPTTPNVPTFVDWERVESIASQRLNEGRLWAEVQYQSALIALGLATPSPSSNMEKYYEQAKINYYAGLGLAQDRYSSFLAGASSALYSMTATPTPTDLKGSASSIAAAVRESASSAALKAGGAANQAYSAAGDAAGSAYSAAGDSVSSAGDAAGSVVAAASDTIASAAQVVDDTVSSVVDAANEQISSAGEAVVDMWGNVVAEVSRQIYGGEQPSHIGWDFLNDAGAYAASATEAAGSSAVTASAEASKQYDSVSQLVSELLIGKEPAFTDSVFAKLQAAYATAAASVESLASEASVAAASVGDRVNSAASQATDSVKENLGRKDEL